MTLLLERLKRVFGRREPVAAERSTVAPTPAQPATVRDLDMAPNDPLLAYLQGSPGVIDLDTLRLESPMVARLKAEGARLAVPLLSQGELVGMLTLGPRRSEQDYASDDHSLLANLATQAAPALRVAQLVRLQRAEARERERIAQELRVARLIQQTLLPREIPAIAGWSITPYYEPAREVGGDFYDFIPLERGRIGLVIADVTDKGVPAALVMATTRSVLRGVALRLETPGEVLARVNEILVPDVPANMFITCFYAVLDPATGHLQYANAGHDVPYWRGADGQLRELRARGMPLGLMEGMAYEQHEACLEPGDHILLYSDGVVEAHDTQRAMFSFERMAGLVADSPVGGQRLLSNVLSELAAFTGPDWVQEDDITLVSIRRELEAAAPDAPIWRTLAEFEIASAPDNERVAMHQVAAAVANSGLTPTRLERLKTAVAEATMNAMEHGNSYRADHPTYILVRQSNDAVSVRILDHGAGPLAPADEPDLEAKLAGLQTPRGWGLHLIRHMVDDLIVSDVDDRHVVELVVRLADGQS